MITIEDIQKKHFKHLHEIFHETDCSAVIIGSTLIEGYLEGIINTVIPRTHFQKDELYDGMGPFSTFSSKIIISERLMLIDAELASVLKTLRKIRNTFAHGFSEISLNDNIEAGRVISSVNVLKSREKSNGLYSYWESLLPVNQLSQQAYEYRLILCTLGSIFYYYLEDEPVFKLGHSTITLNGTIHKG